MRIEKAIVEAHVESLRREIALWQSLLDSDTPEAIPAAHPAVPDLVALSEWDDVHGQKPTARVVRGLIQSPPFSEAAVKVGRSWYVDRPRFLELFREQRPERRLTIARHIEAVSAPRPTERSQKARARRRA